MAQYLKHKDQDLIVNRTGLNRAKSSAMIRRFFPPMFPCTKVQVTATAGSLIFGLLAVVLTSAFMRYDLRLGALPEGADRIFKVNKWIEKPGEQRMPSVKTPGLMAPALASDLPEIEAAGRVMMWPEAVTLGNMDRNTTVKRWAFADPAFLRVFKPEFIQGNAASALDKPGQVVLTESLAKKLFGKTQIVGQSLMGLGGKIYRVSGVVRNPGPQSAVQFDALASWCSTEKDSGFHDFRFMNNWIGQTVETYLLLREGNQSPVVEQRLSQVLQAKAPGQPGQYGFFLKPVAEPRSQTGAPVSGKFSNLPFLPLSGNLL